MSKLPSITSQVPRDVRLFLDRVREKLSSGSLVTKEQLESGEVVPAKAGEAENSDGLQETDPNTGCVVVTTPPAPLSLEAEGAYRGIFISWEPAIYCGHAYTEVWAAEENDLSKAVKIGISPGAEFVHQVGTGVTRYYWAYHVTINNAKSAVSAQQGVEASSAPDVQALIEQLSNDIDNSELDSALDEAINLVDADKTIEGAIAYQVWGNNQAIQVEAETRQKETGELYAQYTVKIDQDGRVSGYGLASTGPSETGGEGFSEFIVNADRFSVGAPSATGIKPFIATTTPQTINGEYIAPGVYMDAAYIANGTITKAKIGEAAIDSAKIAEIEAGKIRSGVIESTVTIESADYNPSTNSGWKIESGGPSSGNAIFNNAFVRGTVFATDGEFAGDLRNSGATTFSAGTGLWSGTVNNEYRFRVGSPVGAGLEWDGDNVRITRDDGTTLFSSGEYMESRDGKMRVDFSNKFIYMEL